MFASVLGTEQSQCCLVLAVTADQLNHSDVVEAKKLKTSATTLHTELSKLSEQSFRSAALLLGDDGVDVNSIIGSIVGLLPGGGRLAIRLLPECGADMGSVKLALLIGGFMNVEEVNGEVECTKAEEVVKDGVVKVALPSANETIWKVTEDGADDLVDEDDLLLDERADTGVLQKDVDCGTEKGGKRRACKNCSCGLREMLEKDIAEGKEVPKSSCGSCHKGDAFRCASCPFLGKPAFEPGQEKLVLKVDDADVMDQKVMTGEGGNISFEDDPIF